MKMISCALLINFLAFYLFYNTSEKSIKAQNFGFEKWIEKSKKVSKLWGLLLLLMSCVAFCYMFGFGSGILFFMISLMAFGSLVLMITPMKILKPRLVIIIFMLSLYLEFLIF